MRVGDGRVMFIKGKLMPSDTEYEVVRTIVQCKDCKYWAELTFLVPPKHHCGRLLQQYKGISERVSFETDADDFCSRGEKR